MIEGTGCTYGQLYEAEPFVSVSSSQYEKLLRLSNLTEVFADTIAEDWINGARQGFGEPSDTLKIMLKLYNRELYRQTEQKAKEAEEKHQKELSEKLEIELAKQAPAVYPYIPQDHPGWPYKGIEITCESKDVESE